MRAVGEAPPLVPPASPPPLTELLPVALARRGRSMVLATTLRGPRYRVAVAVAALQRPTFPARAATASPRFTVLRVALVGSRQATARRARRVPALACPEDLVAVVAVVVGLAGPVVPTALVAVVVAVP